LQEAVQGGWGEAVNYFYFIPEAGIADFLEVFL